MEFLKSDVSQDSETGDTSREKFVIPEDGTMEVWAIASIIRPIIRDY